MNSLKLSRIAGGILSIILLSSCARGPSPRVQFVDVGSTSSTVSTTTTTLTNCSPNPSVQAFAVGQVNRGLPATIRFSGWGMCNLQFKVIGFPGMSSALALDITDVFNYGGSQVRQYNIQMVDGLGNAVGSFFSIVLTLNVYDSSPTTTIPVTTTSTTLISTVAPSCTLERVVDATHPPTSNGQQSIWVRFQTFGTNVSSTLNGYSLGSGVFEVRTSSFPFFEMEGNVSNGAGTSSCRLSVATSYCIQNLVGQVQTTSVTTELTALGTYDSIYIQGVRQSNPSWLLPWVAYTETFAGSSTVRNRETTGLVQSFGGDSWSCPVSYTVPAQLPARPSNFMNLGEYLLAGDSLVPSGANVCGCRAVMQGDGNFVVYRGTKALWSSQTWRHSGAYFTLQNDGNMVVYKGTSAKWSSSTNRRGAWQLHMQGDCNLVLYTYNFSSAIWSSHSAQSGCY